MRPDSRATPWIASQSRLGCRVGATSCSGVEGGGTSSGLVVYTTLQRLERDGLVESDQAESAGSQKNYTINVRGRQELDRWLQTPSELDSPPRDELVIKVLVAAGFPESMSRM